MDAQTRDNWRKIKQALEAAGKTNNHYYRRALAILAGRPDPFDRYDGTEPRSAGGGRP
jgi:hypothetical protein